MFKIKREGVKWVALTLVAVGVLFWSVAPRVSAVPPQTYEDLRIFTDAVSIIERNYAEEVEPKELVYSAVKGVLQGLDPHSTFMTPDDYKEMQVGTRGRFGGIGIEIGIRDRILTVISPIEDTPADKAGIKAGDKIVKIEEKYTKDMTLLDAVKLMRGKKGTDVTISIMREGFEKPKPFTLTRAIIKIKSVKFKVLEEGFGYLRIAQFQEKTSSDVEAALKELGSRDGKLKGLVLDLRNDPGGLLNQAVEVSDKFISSGLIVYTKGRVPGQDMKFEARAESTHPDYPIIVLVNGGSASASEIVAGALQDHKRAIILGTQTFGKGSVQTIIPLTDGSAIKLTTSKYYTPLGRSIQAKGIEPDIVVGKTIKGHIKEKDLTGHFKSEDEKAGKVDKVKKKVRVEEKTALSKESDVQLDRALDYLKSWYIFQGTVSKLMM
ncbi:MAG: S41 family peptidase [Thermodesulfobacteriota bacterium]